MRAILLAAGMGTRLRPITYETPKSLIQINGKPLIERQIEFLNEIDINEIIVVTGYLNEKFNYLKQKYNVKLVYNDKYNIYNNIYTMYLVREYLPNSYVIDADTYLSRNFLEKKLANSTYFAGKKKVDSEEWMLIFDENNKVNDIKISSGEGYIMSGVSYWSNKDGEYLIKKIEEALVKSEDWHNLYWDNIVKNNIKNLDVYIKKIDGSDWYEIDSLDDLNKLKLALRSEVESRGVR
ncbi:MULTISPECIES: CTP--phosphocholine cytidylyltransferase [Caloramator]|uniref:CTP:phosphocholine cytidylyltransferase n=1 Tax=Caloramator proteoclasticus DSM 10124 TaxID=1121262 RepID=A0A1M4YF06_9CLOT|nr:MULTISPECIES: CTP--phosphocholine cytidylyltransferase [Caloramator]SHF04228.1 CTP:phosphocholine cytidylyltransferase [Caloramator proteoclasticus DSM 10124]